MYPNGRTEQLGHPSPVVTLNVYSHLYAGDLDRLYDGLDATRARADVAQVWPKLIKERTTGVQ